MQHNNRNNTVILRKSKPRKHYNDQRYLHIWSQLSAAKTPTELLTIAKPSFAIQKSKKQFNSLLAYSKESDRTA
jgi:hypothetical protein